MMTAASLILLVAQLLPSILDDYTRAAAVLGSASVAVTNAQAGDGTISAADWAALDAHVSGDLAGLAVAAGIGVPTA